MGRVLSKGALMLKIINMVTTLLFCLTFSACSSLDTKTSFNGGAVQWDFDHSVQFRQMILPLNHYQLEIISNNKVNFERLATFLLRKSYNLCHHYGYQLEILQGVEGYDDKFAEPNRILPSLVAIVDCSIQ
jgi:hypothetical protein